MPVTIRPELEREPRNRLPVGEYRSPDDLVNKFIAAAYESGELEQMLELGTRRAAADQFIDEAEVVRRLQELPQAR